MTRITQRATVPPWDFNLLLELVGGPSEHTEDELELAWRAYHHEATLKRPGQRPWAFWRFEVGQDPPDEDRQPIRLAELGLLSDEEIAAIAERANVARTRIGTDAEHHGPDCWPDRDAVTRHEAVTAALQARS